MITKPIQALIAEVDENGRCEFSTAEADYLERERGQSLNDFFVAHILDLMGDYDVFTIRYDTVKSSRKELDIQAVPEEGTGHYRISFNAARMMRLPGLNPIGELRELSELFDSLRQFFKANAARWPKVSVKNHRDSNRRTYGTLSCIVRDGKDGKGRIDDEATAQLMRRIEASPALSAWLRQLALDLNRVGPHSWFVFTDEHFFTFDENPVVRQLLNRSRQSESAPAKDALHDSVPSAESVHLRRNHTGRRFSFF